MENGNVERPQDGGHRLASLHRFFEASGDFAGLSATVGDQLSRGGLKIMARPGPQTLAKRQRERAKKDKRRAKEEKKALRKAEKMRDGQPEPVETDTATLTE